MALRAQEVFGAFEKRAPGLESDTGMFLRRLATFLS